jgi:hypothetical protein
MRKLEELSKKELMLLVERYESILSGRAADNELDNGPFAHRPRRKEVSEDGVVLDRMRFRTHIGAAIPRITLRNK